MQYFEETQRFNPLFILLIVFAEIGIFYGLYQKTSGFSEFNDPVMVLITILFMILLSLLFLLRLDTRISSSGILAVFQPFPFFTRKFNWHQIEKIHLRKYSAISEFGGWGVRGAFPAKAYTTRGNYGIQIVTKAGRRFLIGTQRPGEVKKLLQKLKKLS